MKKTLNNERPVKPGFEIDKELDKVTFRISQQKLDKLDEIAKRAPLPDLHQRKG